MNAGDVIDTAISGGASLGVEFAKATSFCSIPAGPTPTSPGATHLGFVNRA